MDTQQYTLDLTRRVNEIILGGRNPLEDEDFELLNTFFGNLMRACQKIIGGGAVGGGVASTLIVIVEEKKESREVLEKILTRYRDAGWEVSVNHLGYDPENGKTLLVVTTIMHPGHQKGPVSPTDVAALQNVATDQKEVALIVDKINTFLKASAEKCMSQNAFIGFAYQNVIGAFNLFRHVGWEITAGSDKDVLYYEFSPKKS